jgi:hypothetical protein
VKRERSRPLATVGVHLLQETLSMHRRACLLLAALTVSSAALAEPTKILFVGNSYTFGRSIRS